MVPLTLPARAFQTKISSVENASKRASSFRRCLASYSITAGIKRISAAYLGEVFGLERLLISPMICLR